MTLWGNTAARTLTTHSWSAVGSWIAFVADKLTEAIFPNLERAATCTKAGFSKLWPAAHIQTNTVVHPVNEETKHNKTKLYPPATLGSIKEIEIWVVESGKGRLRQQHVRWSSGEAKTKDGGGGETASRRWNWEAEQCGPCEMMQTSTASRLAKLFLSVALR